MLVFQKPNWGMMLKAILRQCNLENTKVSFILCFYLLILDGKSQSVQSLSHVWLSATPWTAACQASLSITNSRSLLKLMSIESVMPSNHFILCCPLLLLPLIFPSSRVFSNESVLHIRWPKYWSFSLSISPSNDKGSYWRIFRWIKSVLSCVWLCDPKDHSPPGSSVHGISQARILEWIAISSSRGSSWSRDQTSVSWGSCIGRQILCLGFNRLGLAISLKTSSYN